VNRFPYSKAMLAALRITYVFGGGTESVEQRGGNDDLGSPLAGTCKSRSSRGEAMAEERAASWQNVAGTAEVCVVANLLGGTNLGVGFAASFGANFGPDVFGCFVVVVVAAAVAAGVAAAVGVGVAVVAVVAVIVVVVVVVALACGIVVAKARTASVLAPIRAQSFAMGFAKMLDARFGLGVFEGCAKRRRGS